MNRSEIISLLKEALKNDKDNDFLQSLNRSAIQYQEQEKRVSSIATGKTLKDELKAIDEKFDHLLELYNHYTENTKKLGEIK